MNKLKLGEIVQFNPQESIKKGFVAKKNPMEKLLPHAKKILGFDKAKYSAGPKFRNGDTLLAKITPCLENGKTVFFDILNEKEVAFGSSEFIVLRAINHISNKLQKILDNKDIWTISRLFTSITFFLYTDEQLKMYESSPIKKEWSDRYFDLLKKSDKFGYYHREKFDIFLDSKENFDNNYNSNWMYYYKS